MGVEERPERELVGAGESAVTVETGLSEMDRALALLRDRGGPPVEDVDRHQALGFLVRRGFDLELAFDAVRLYGDEGVEAA